MFENYVFFIVLLIVFFLLRYLYNFILVKGFFFVIIVYELFVIVFNRICEVMNFVFNKGLGNFLMFFN